MNIKIDIELMLFSVEKYQKNNKKLLFIDSKNA